MASLIESSTNEFSPNMGKPQGNYTVDNHFFSTSLVPSKMRQKLYYLQSILNACALNENVMTILEGEVERMFASLDELERVMHKLDGQMNEVDEINYGDEKIDDELLMIYQNVVRLIKGMEENMDLLEKLIHNCAEKHNEFHATHTHSTSSKYDGRLIRPEGVNSWIVSTIKRL
ncbi:655_t:CDS:2 [Funneliformis caledonium]|uniref:655_t:CDS:1 n=1 Tax=Funneliformis caledonium TaxID=1117310 RepID=A0A9N9CI68_9GLOM|nr:655_t:CDS:2 [Funneliformis caledonium]